MTVLDFLWRYNKRQLSRIYPRGSRVESSNYMPQVKWVWFLEWQIWLSLVLREILIWGVLLQSLVRINKPETQICNLFSRELDSDSHICQKDFVNGTVLLVLSGPYKRSCGVKTSVVYNCILCPCFVSSAFSAILLLKYNLRKLNI